MNKDKLIEDDLVFIYYAI